jgi:hypothetical protein
MAYSDIRRIVCIGRDARFSRALTELELPTPGARHRLIIVVSDHDVDILRGFRPEELRYIPMSPTQYQLDFLATRRHERISLEEASAWLKEQG